MKKTLTAAIVLMLGLVFQVQAANTNVVQGNKQDQSDSQAQGGQAGNAVQTEEKNKVKNQGENTQIQTQEQNTTQTQDSGKDKTNEGSSGSHAASGSDTSSQRKRQVANAVQVILQIAEREGGIGQQIRLVARGQSQNQEKLEQDTEEIQSRGGFAKFFIGPDYGKIKDAQANLEQNREQIRQLNQLRTQLNNTGDQQQLAEQIQVLEQANREIETALTNAQSGFSLFGWLNKLIS